MRNFKNYEVWKLSHGLVLKIYELVSEFPDEEKFAMVSQMKRAAYSVSSNFAEGCGRMSDKEFNRFLQISLGSAHELEYFVLLAKDLKYIDKVTFSTINEDINKIKSMLYKLSQKLG